MPTLFAIAAFIQALGQNPGIEQVLARARLAGARLRRHRTRRARHDRVGSLQLHRAQRRWDRFWAAPERNEPLRRFLAGEGAPEGAPRPSIRRASRRGSRGDGGAVVAFLGRALAGVAYLPRRDARDRIARRQGTRRDRQARPDQGEAAADPAHAQGVGAARRRPGERCRRTCCGTSTTLQRHRSR